MNKPAGGYPAAIGQVVQLGACRWTESSRQQCVDTGHVGRFGAGKHVRLAEVVMSEVSGAGKQLTAKAVPPICRHQPSAYLICLATANPARNHAAAAVDSDEKPLAAIPDGLAAALAWPPREQRIAA
jgi:hypothetical protein